MKLINCSTLLLIFFSYLSVHGVNFINVSPCPIYFSVYYKRGKSVVRQIEKIYTAESNGAYFLNNHKFDHKDAHLKVAAFPWPPQKCVEFSDEELTALAVGMGTAVLVTGGAAGVAGAAAEAGFGLGALAGGTAGGAIIAKGQGLCKAEHYPRTVLFSFWRRDLTQLNYDMGELQDDQSRTGLYLGDNVDGGETHFLFYNPYGFDPRYAAYGAREGHNAIKGGRINSVWYEASKPLLADTLRNYLRFVDYMGGQSCGERFFI